MREVVKKKGKAKNGGGRGGGGCVVGMGGRGGGRGSVVDLIAILLLFPGDVLDQRCCW